MIENYYKKHPYKAPQMDGRDRSIKKMGQNKSNKHLCQ